MIVYDLVCDGGHRFEGWFSSSAAFAEQQARDLVACPTCGSAVVVKAPMAPAVGAKSNRAAPAPAPAPTRDQAANTPLPPALREAMAAVARIQAEALPRSTWVGDTFASEVRAMHYGEREQALVHGRASPREAAALHEEGIAVAPLLVPFAPPEEQN